MLKRVIIGWNHEQMLLLSWGISLLKNEFVQWNEIIWVSYQYFKTCKFSKSITFRDVILTYEATLFIYVGAKVF